VSTLLKRSPKSLVGVTGPFDVHARSPLLVLTQSMVHRRHLDIFGYYYPPLFRNWFSDDWITQVYQPQYSLRNNDILVNNTNVLGTRYQYDYIIDIVAAQVNAGKEVLQNWLESGGQSLDAAHHH
jgi:hypothetical protein